MFDKFLPEITEMRDRTAKKSQAQSQEDLEVISAGRFRFCSRAIRSMPGIAMSGYDTNEDRRRSHEAGFSEPLVKPIDVPQLIAAIRRVTDNRA